MKIILAETAGFCMGVDMALRKLDSLLLKPDPLAAVHTLGPIIHNPQVLQAYADRGVRRVDDPDVLKPGQTVVIRAHGIPRAIEFALKARGIQLVDATCPKVKKAQLLIAAQAAQGKIMVLLGEGDHPEVRGLLSYADHGAYVVESDKDVEALLEENIGPCFLAAQTTQDRQRYALLAQTLRGELDPDIPVLDTICAATRNRQSEARAIAEQVQAMVVVGGRESGNTRRLALVAEQAGIPCYLVETAAELNMEHFRGLESVGVTAGASTPGEVIQAVVNHLKDLSA
ncbi:4-hydroxy-3-methylbut-2-enyl diphosphate reductase [Desulfonatronum thiosulfatophilum]|uniref:4-hydroxy-3-methylbut-2-enyl diphosphate reductase n=1 Tax=Desulfonatronum thiosulfatophilum TaxID=617002 RepID=A0A1G6ERF6_9BACT|nr:4-hydroxy-3-methylbut-2-enyl diphosphate reductase [Desulfonatronum thiosulfatophilum]SDB59852.1 4-hydroxy-3-methylbut-2-enyl diphosphate reductase [Desulfonatronum thiosulfatophilum]